MSFDEERDPESEREWLIEGDPIVVVDELLRLRREVAELRAKLVGYETLAPGRAFQRRLFEECETANWDPRKTNSFGDEIGHLHEEVSEAFREFRLHHDFATRLTCKDCGRAVPIEIDLDTVRHPTSKQHYTDRGEKCWGDFKPTGIPIEFGDVLIGMAYNAELHDFDLFASTEIKHTFNLTRDYQAEGRALHPSVPTEG